MGELWPDGLLDLNGEGGGSVKRYLGDHSVHRVTISFKYSRTLYPNSFEE
jgi:hypothetical protein